MMGVDLSLPGMKRALPGPVLAWPLVEYRLLKSHPSLHRFLSRSWLVWLPCAAILFTASSSPAQSPAPSAPQNRPAVLLPTIAGAPYAPDKPVAGEIALHGSTLMQPLAVLWMEDFRQIHPEVKPTISCNGSEDSFQKLEPGKSILGLVSRDVSDDELAVWSKEVGAPLVAITVGYDVLALIVHPDNPLQTLGWNTRLSTPLSLKDDTRVTRWAPLGLDPPLADSPIHFHVLSKSHALRAYADRMLLAGDDSAKALTEHETQLDVLEAVAQDKAGLGLISAHRVDPKKAKAIYLSTGSEPAVAPTDLRAIDRGYPMVRKLSLVLVAQDPSQKNPLLDEFLAFVLSRQGQEVLCKDGLVPLDGSELLAQQEKLGWSVLK